MESAFVGSAVAEESHRDPIQTHVLGGQRGAGSDRDAGSHNGVGAQHAQVRLGNMHRAALALVITGGFAEKLCHRLIEAPALGNHVPVTAVSAGDLIVHRQVGANASRHSFLADVRVQKTGDLTPGKQLDDSLLKFPDAYHQFIQLQPNFR